MIESEIAPTGQKQKKDDVNNAYALSGRIHPIILTQGDAPGFMLVGPSGRCRPLVPFVAVVQQHTKMDTIISQQ